MTTDVLVVKRVDGVPPPVAGSVIVICELCGSDCWMAPSSQPVRAVGMPVWCVQCALTEVERAKRKHEG